MNDKAVSIAKAWGIILMVLCHAEVSLPVRAFVATFHMPLFFFYAGYCFKDKYLSQPVEFVKRRINGLYVPFVKWGLFFLFLHNILFRLNIYNEYYGLGQFTSHLYSLPEYCKNALFVIGAMRGQERLIGGYWFLHDLFFASLIAFWVLKFIKYRILGGAFLIVVTGLFYYGNMSIPFWEINSRVMLGVCLFFAGKQAKDIGLMGYIVSRKALRVSLFVLSFFLVALGAIVNKASMFETTLQNFIPYLFCAISGTVMIYLASSYICERMSSISSMMNYVGTHTLEVLTWHFSSFKIISLIIILVYDLDFKILAQHPTIFEYGEKGWWIAYFLTGVLVPCGVAFAVEKIKSK